MTDQTNYQATTTEEFPPVSAERVFPTVGNDSKKDERRRKRRSFEDVAIDSSVNERSFPNSESDESLAIPEEIELQSGLNTEKSKSFYRNVEEGEKRMRPALMDKPTPTVDDPDDDNIPTFIPYENNHQTKEEYRVVSETKSITFNASSWSVGPRYKLIRLLGRGSYGEVAEAHDLSRAEGDQKVAIKRIISAFDKALDAIRLFREIHLLRLLRGHACIIQLLDIIPRNVDDISTFHELYLVFDYIDTDLYKLIMSPQYLTTEHIQTFMYQILIALKYMHSYSVIHRDLKPANILLNEDCSLKICDFGLARIIDYMPSGTSTDSLLSDNVSNEIDQSTYGDNIIDRLKTISTPKLIGLNRQLTRHVTTRWYRAPELILIQPYTSAVDIWSIGCIFAELLSMQKEVVPIFENRSPLFPGKTCFPLSSDRSPSSCHDKMDQLMAIFEVLGKPSDEDIAASASKYIHSIQISCRRPLASIYQNADKAALDLLEKMLQFNPDKRISAAESLEHEFLRNIRRPDMEIASDKPFISPDFLNSDTLSVEEIKRKIAEEINLHIEMSK